MKLGVLPRDLLKPDLLKPFGKAAASGTRIRVPPGGPTHPNCLEGSRSEVNPKVRPPAEKERAFGGEGATDARASAHAAARRRTERDTSDSG